MHFLRRVAQVLVSAVALHRHVAHGWPAPGNYSMDLNVLVIYNSEDDLIVPRLVLDGFNTLWTRAQGRPPALEDGRPLYSAIVISADETEFDEGDLQRLRDYAKRWHVRMVHLNPTSENVRGVALSEYAENAPSPGRYLVFDNSTAAISIGDVLNTKIGWEVTPSVMWPRSGSLHATDAVPLLRYSDNACPNSTASIAAHISTQDSVEEMFFLFDATRHEMSFDEFTGRDDPGFVREGEYTETSLALGSMWLVWATRGIYVGQRRLHVNVHVDDYFISSPQYNSTQTLRIDGTSCRTNIDLQDALTAALPRGSAIVFENAFNGLGYAQDDYETQGKGAGLTGCAKELRSRYFWVSHTYSHKHLDWMDADECNGTSSECRETYDRIAAELRLNVELIEGREINPTIIPKYRAIHNIAAGSMFHNDTAGLQAYFSSQSLVTPEISGLVPNNYSKRSGDRHAHRVYGAPRNVGSLSAVKDAGIKYLTGDSSRVELLSRHNHHGLYTSKQGWGVAGLLIVNRRPSIVDYTVSTPEQFLKSWVDRDHCNNTGGIPCRQFNVSLASTMQREAAGHVLYYLQYNVDPIMFHQTNVHVFDLNGRPMSLLALWTEHVTQRLTRWISRLPVVSLKMDDLGRFVEARMQRDACNIKAQLQVVDGVVSGITVRGNSSCEVLLSLSGQAATLVPDLKASQSLTSYGPDRTIGLPVTATTPNHLALSARPATRPSTPQVPPTEASRPKPPGPHRNSSSTTVTLTASNGAKKRSNGRRHVRKVRLN